MRKDAIIFGLFAFCSVVQVSVLNVISGFASFNLPLIALLLAIPSLSIRRRLVATVAAALPLDYSSALPFGSYLICFGLVAAAASYAGRRIPIRNHQSFKLLLVASGSLITFLALLGLSSMLSVFRLAPWPISIDRQILLTDFLALLAVNTVLCAVLFVVQRIVRPLIQRRFFVTHAPY